jgi:hypothetical protein
MPQGVRVAEVPLELAALINAAGAGQRCISSATSAALLAACAAASSISARCSMVADSPAATVLQTSLSVL